MKKTSIIEFENYEKSVQKTLDAIGASDILLRKQNILLKPNLVEASTFPITTSLDCIQSVINYIKKCSDARIIIAEGTGSAEDSTLDVYHKLGYDKFAKQNNVDLLDLNDEPLIKLTNPDFKIFREYYIPEIAFETFIISLPVLKAHSLSTVTLALKNMMGFAPPKHYQCVGSWKKSFFHQHIEEAIIEMNAYRSADLILLDATIGMADYHLGGAHCNPPVNKMVAGYDSVEIDKIGAELLGFDWKTIKHIADFNNYINTK